MDRGARPGVGLRIAASLAAFASGCSLLVDLSDTTSGDGNDGGIVVETGGPADGAPGTDAGADAQPPADASAEATIEAGFEAEADAAYSPDSWCAQNAPAAFFCDDFDEGPLLAGWTSSLLELASGDGRLSTTAALSPPYGFEIAAPALTPATYLHEILTEDTPAASQVSLAFDFEPLTYPPSGALYLADLIQGSGEPRSALQFRAGPDLTDLQEQIILDGGASKPGTGQWESATIIQTGRWTHVAMSIDFTTSPATASLALDGQLVVTATLDPAWTRQPGSVDVGDWYIPTTPAFDVAYDNVVITVTP